MKLLIVYGTNSTSTLEASELIAQELRRPGHDVVLRNARDTNPGDLKGFDVVLLGACTWEKQTPTAMLNGQLQADMDAMRERFMGSDFSGQKFAVFGLGDHNYTHFCMAATRLEKFVAEMKGTKVGETLKVDRFFYDIVENRARIVRWAKELARTLALAHL